MSLDQISSKFTTQVLDEIIVQAGGVKYKSYKFGEGFKKGDSYLSKVFRLCVSGVRDDGTDLEVNLIVKSIPDNHGRRKLFRSAVFFRNEINFYTKVVPAWEAFQARRKPKHPFVDYPKCYACYCDGENDFIALGDVSFSGYTSPQRQDYVSLDDSILIMQTLGRFHGISLAFNALEPENFEQIASSLEETYYSELYRTWYSDFLNLACIVAKDAVSKTLPGSKYETIANQFLQHKSLYDDMIKLVSTKSKLSVIGHGDCWTPNFLSHFKPGSNTADSIVVIDFQLARCASLVLDLIFFIYSCTSQTLREQHYDQLLKEYHTSACALIADLGGDPATVFSWEQLQSELRSFGRFGCGMGIESLPMTLIDDADVADLDEVTENAVLTDVWDIKPFKEAAKRERIAQVFQHAIDREYLK